MAGEYCEPYQRLAKAHSLSLRRSLFRLQVPSALSPIAPLGSVSLCFATSLTVVCQATVRDPNDLYSESLSPFGASMYNLAHTYEAQGQGDSGLNVHPVEVPLAPAPIYTTA